MSAGNLADSEEAPARARDGPSSLDRVGAQSPDLLRGHVLAQALDHVDPRRKQLRVGPPLEPALQEGVVRRARGDVGLLGALEDLPALSLVDRTVRPRHLDQGDQGERRHDLGPDAELEQLVEDGLVLDPGAAR